VSSQTESRTLSQNTAALQIAEHDPGCIFVAALLLGFREDFLQRLLIQAFAVRAL
jgi:hypothetical protein